MRIKKLVEKVLKETPDLPRTFPAIQDELFINLTLEDQGLRTALLKGDVLYEVLNWGIRLYSDVIGGIFENTRRREIETFGLGLEQLPDFYRQVLVGPAKAGILSIGDRGYVYIVELGDKRCVVKPLQSEDEHEIAPIAAEVLAGPAVIGIGDEWLAEEFVDGPSLLHAGVPAINVAGEVGRIYGSLHKRGVIYNDYFPRHFHLLPDRAVLIDYGCSYHSDNFSSELVEISNSFSGSALRHFERSYRAAFDGR